MSINRTNRTTSAYDKANKSNETDMNEIGKEE
jgi:hypothetical protein